MNIFDSINLDLLIPEVPGQIDLLLNHFYKEVVRFRFFTLGCFSYSLGNSAQKGF